jgi:hypothetical protein
VSDEDPRVLDHVQMERLNPEQDAISQVAQDLRRAGFGVSTGELALLLDPSRLEQRPPAAEVDIAGQPYLAYPRTDGQPGLRLVHRLRGEPPEREHR